MSMNHLDAVWANLSTADRFVLLGHDRPHLDADDKARLATLVAAKANRTAAQRPARGKGRGPGRRPGTTRSRRVPA